MKIKCLLFGHDYKVRDRTTTRDGYRRYKVACSRCEKTKTTLIESKPPKPTL